MDFLGIEFTDLPDGATALEVVVLVKVIDADGHVGLVERSSKGLTLWEALGMATTFADTMRDQLRDAWGPAQDDD
jgi:hypothetical protein